MLAHWVLVTLAAQACAAASAQDADHHSPPYSYLKQRPKPPVFYPKLDNTGAQPNADLISQCTVHWYNVTLDHFSWVLCIATPLVDLSTTMLLHMHH